MDIDKALNQARPILRIAGTALIAIGVAKFFGLDVNFIRGSGLEIAVAGYLTKSI